MSPDPDAASSASRMAEVARYDAELNLSDRPKRIMMTKNIIEDDEGGACGCGKACGRPSAKLRPLKTIDEHVMEAQSDGDRARLDSKRDTSVTAEPTETQSLTTSDENFDQLRKYVEGLADNLSAGQTVSVVGQKKTVEEELDAGLECVMKSRKSSDDDVELTRETNSESHDNIGDRNDEQMMTTDTVDDDGLVVVAGNESLALELAVNKVAMSRTLTEGTDNKSTASTNVRVAEIQGDRRAAGSVESETETAQTSEIFPTSSSLLASPSVGSEQLDDQGDDSANVDDSSAVELDRENRELTRKSTRSARSRCKAASPAAAARDCLLYTSPSPRD